MSFTPCTMSHSARRTTVAPWRLAPAPSSSEALPALKHASSDNGSVALLQRGGPKKGGLGHVGGLRPLAQEPRSCIKGLKAF